MPLGWALLDGELVGITLGCALALGSNDGIPEGSALTEGELEGSSLG
jgi:hypothetical protein